MPTPLHQVKAELFKALANPMRIRVLELLSEQERSVAEMLVEIGVEASALSQQLAVLRAAGLVKGRRDGSNVYYTVTTPHVADLLAVARRLRTDLMARQLEILSDLRAEEEDATAGSPESQAGR